MTTTTATGRSSSAIRNGATLMAVAAAGFIGYAGLFLVRNFTNSFLELGIGPKEVDVSKDQIQQFSPSLYHYIGHLHIALCGFIAATGLAVLLLAIFGVRSGQVWAWVAAVAAPVLALAIALPAHYPWNLDTLGHLGLIYLATLVFVAGAVLSGKGLLDARRTTGSYSRHLTSAAPADFVVFVRFRRCPIEVGGRRRWTVRGRVGGHGRAHDAPAAAADLPPR